MISNKLAIFLSVLFAVVSCDTENTVTPRYKSFFIKYHGGDGNQTAAQLLQTDDGGYIIVGSSVADEKPEEEIRGSQIVLIKTDEFGNEEWQSTFGRENDDTGIAVEILPGGTGYYVAGNSVNNAGYSDVLLLQVSSLGNMEDSVVLGSLNFDEEVNDILILNANDLHGAAVMIAGSTTNTDKFLVKESMGLVDDYDFFYPKLDVNLVPISLANGWRGYWGFEGTDKAVGIAQDANNNFVISGTTNRSEPEDNSKDKNNFYLKTFDENEQPGNKGGGISFGNGDDQFVSEMSPTLDGGQLMVGTTFSGTNSDIFVSRTNSANEEIVSFSLTKVENTQGKAIVQARGGGYLILGSIIRNANSDIYLLKTDDRGAVIWEQVFGGNNEDLPGDLIQLEDGSIIFSCTITLENQQKIGLFKTNENGKLLD